jgi:diguanylate cyclase (GGDEF)-like protein
MDFMKIASITLVLVGIVLLVFSLNPTISLCRREHKFSLSWRLLSILIVFFIVGYILFLNFMFHCPVSYLLMIVATILFGGSIFVIIVVRLCLASIRISEHQALHDKLTELPNRVLVEDRLDHDLKVAKRHDKSLAFLLMDLVNFKEVNDSFGHFYGDYILQEVAHRMKSVVRESDTLARFGGDEFAVVLLGNDQEQAEIVSMKIADVLDTPFMIEGHSLKVGISIGIAMYPEHSTDTDTLVQQADQAMYEAKRNDIVYTVFNSSIIRPDSKS